MSTAVLLLALAGFLAGGAWTLRRQSRAAAAVLAVLAALAAAGGVLRLVPS